MKIKWSIFLSLMFLISSIVLAVTYDGGSLLQNGNFENATQNWEIKNAELTTTAYEGKNSLLLKSSSNQVSQIAQTLTVSSDQKALMFYGFAKTENSTSRVDISFIGTDGLVLGKTRSLSFSKNADWKSYNLYVKVPKFADKVKVVVSNTNGTLVIDALGLDVVPVQSFVAFENVEDETNPFSYVPNVSTVNNLGDNWLKNSSFEEEMTNWLPWSADVSITTNEHNGGNAALKISQDSPKWMGATQTLDLPKGVNKVTLSCKIKTDNVVQGANPWEKVICKVIFKGASGEEIQEGVAAEMIGTKDWKTFIKSFSVPAKTKTIEVVCALGNCTGTAYFDDIILNDKEPDFSTIPTEIVNGNFEEGLDSWNQWGAVPFSEAKVGANCAFIENDNAKWSGCQQEIPLQKGVKIIEFSGWVKTEKVVGGRNNWEKAVYKIEFLNAKGEAIGDNTIAGLTGTTPWTFYKKNFKVPANAQMVRVLLALGNSTGKVWFDDLSVQVGSEDAYVAERAVLINGGFENGMDGWPDWAGEIATVSHTGNSSLVVKNDTKERKWIMRRQSIAIPKGSQNFKLAAWVKLENAEKMSNGWEGARVYVTYKDKSGNDVPNAESKLFKGDGNSDWQQISGEYSVPNGASEINVHIGLANAFGAIYADDVELTFESKEDLYKSVKEGWYVLDTKPDMYSGHYADWSSLLDAPAGKHGFLKVQNGKEVFEDGTLARFWGVNMTAEFCFLEKARADSLANRYAKMGCNLVRFHHLEAPWGKRNLFGGGDVPSTRKLDPESMDKLDYLIAAFKKKGIYVYLDLLVQRQFRPNDVAKGAETENGAKQAGVFDDKLIELQKEFNEQMFTHINKYTGFAYKDDPVFIGSELVNETWIGGQWQGDILTPYYAKVLDDKFAKSPFYAGKPRSVLKQLPPLNIYCAQRLTAENKNSDSVNTMKFLLHEEAKYVDEMTAHLRKVGVKYPIAYTNFPYSFTALLKNKSKGDIIINNTYWSHPWDYDLGALSPTYIRSQLHLHNASLIVQNAMYAVKGKPFMVTEWNACYPNPQRCDGVPMMAAYGSLQGWQNFTQFTMSDDPNGATSLTPFGVANDPIHMAQWVVGAPMFLRGDIKEAKSVFRHTIKPELVTSLPNQDPFLPNNFFLPYVTKFENSFENDSIGKINDFAKYIDTKNEVYASETDELKIDGKQKIFTVKAPKTQGVVAEFKGKKIDLPFFKVNVDNDFASVFAVSKDNKDLVNSKNFFLVVTTNVEMKGQEWDPNFREDWKAGGNGQLRKAGIFPLLAEMAKGKLVIKKDIDISKIKVSTYTMYGSKINQNITLQKTSAGIELDLSQLRSFVVEITIE
ncbi:MAG: carbohydrate binding domain-containing protein [Cytophagales bacterium]